MGGSGTTAGSGGSSTTGAGAGATTTSNTTATSGAGGGPPPVTCPAAGDALSPGVHELNIVHELTDRSYDVQVPASYDNQSPIPLVFDIHGLGGSKQQQGSASGFAELAEQEGFAVVRPQGSGILASWNGGDSCCGYALDNDVDDVGLMIEIAKDVQEMLCIDPRRIYATGHSNGAALTHRLACEAADTFAAVAPVSFPINFNPFTKCAPYRAVGVMHSHGDSDGLVPMGGNFMAQPTPSSFAYWASVGDCVGDPTVTFEQGNSRCETYSSCDDGVSVSLCTVSGGHQLYSNNDNVDIAAVSWEFLKAHVRP